MEDHTVLGDEVSVRIGREEEDDEFCSCYDDDDDDDDEEELCKECVEEVVVEKEKLKEDCDECSVKMFFKGLSIEGAEKSMSGYSGIGVVMERPSGLPDILVQKKLDFYADKLLAEYLALIDGLLEAMRNDIRRVYAFTDSELLYDQVRNSKCRINISSSYTAST